MAQFKARVSIAQRVQDKLARLDGGNKMDARREKEAMVQVPHKVAHSRQGEEWREGTTWKGAKGKEKRVHTPR